MFVVFEGPEGSGKSTQISRLYDYLRRRGTDVLLTREPGGTLIGEQIRAVLHDVENTAMLPGAEILLYSASRAQLVGEVILPALGRGQSVLCDRYAYSTLAYQGYGHGLDLDLLRVVTDFATGGLEPDTVVYLDIDVEAGLGRKLAAHTLGQAEWNRMDQKEVEFHHRVRRGYLALADADPDRWSVFDADRPAAEIHADIRKRVEPILLGGVTDGDETHSQHRAQRRRK